MRRFGIGAADRVAIVLPNGPEMAAAFVTIAQAAVTAPLNPAYQREEYSFYLNDLRARALVVRQAMTARRWPLQNPWGWRSFACIPSPAARRASFA